MVRTRPHLRHVLAAVLTAGATMSASPGQGVPRCVAMQLPVAGIVDPPSQYADFCARHPAACRLDGASSIAWTEALHRLLGEVNARVNDEVTFVADMDNLGVEERWDFPQDCRGDCEDFALEKRERLVEGGLPRAALTMAFAFHEVQFFPHAVLLVETSTGTWVLDNLHDEVLCWDAVPYRFTRRERPDGRWLRFSPVAP
jgi:predicted transglutaminase-like cysteine proteinase